MLWPFREKRRLNARDAPKRRIFPDREKVVDSNLRCFVSSNLSQNRTQFRSRRAIPHMLVTGGGATTAIRFVVVEIPASR